MQLMANLRILFLVGLLSIPTHSLAGARAQADAVVDCLNEKSALNDELRFFEGEGPIARIREPDDHRNDCTAQNYFCVVSTEVSWMFTWNIVLKVEASNVTGFDMLPGNGQLEYLHVPDEVAREVTECGVDWQGHWVGELIFFEPSPEPTRQVTGGFTTQPWDGTVEDLLPPAIAEN
ncbi:MAG: hypothetical protein HRU32_12675 [Rhodobacteraceae bacterium]|nr:hypothetical protein [Paracoccaceae bacterium]